MFRINLFIIIIVHICLTLVLLILYYVNNKIKRPIMDEDKKNKKSKLLAMLLIILTFILICSIAKYITNKTLYQFETEFQEKFDNFRKIDISGYGPHCYINIYVDEEKSKFEDIEPIFISMMIEVQEKDMYDYIKKEQSKNTNGELVFLHICFYTSNKRGTVSVYEFSSKKDFEEWKLEEDSSKNYNVLDYINK